ncbi:MAG: polysaccharide deacetylase family protein [Pirellulales bacterium]|nr:polysaccharide deacetylase family protein [Pirellulales bacterium]
MLSRLRRANSVAILKYHSVQDHLGTKAEVIGRGIVQSATVFSEQMEILAKHFNPVSLDDVSDFLLDRRTPPRRAIAITFDDGFRDNFEIAAPILEKFGLRATFYITAGCVESGLSPWFCRLRQAFLTSKVQKWTDPVNGQSWSLLNHTDWKTAGRNVTLALARLAGEAQESLLQTIEHGLESQPLDSKDRLMMNWDEMKSLRQRGHLIGSHTISHPNLAHISLDDAMVELCRSKEILEKHLGEEIIHFSYPSPILQPHWTEQTRAMTSKIGYRTAVTCASGAASRKNHPLSLPRVITATDHTDFVWNIESSFLGHSP